ncbi:MAG TPA: helix-turn-helix domain-containing protein [Gaiellaceae bacterium]|jgi:DNA-binding HxlR family transcriptional regulator|nr:helix-turn-helix domain-containing protein [Gaiellaceae bacterium]
MSRTYNQYCGVARALDLVGERWALLVVRGLVLGPKRFTDLKAELPGIGTNVLAARLRELEENNVVRRRRLPPPAASTVYELTEYGRELRSALLALGRWGAKTLGPRQEEQALRSEWLAVALTAFFRPEAAARAEASLELRLTDGTYSARIDRGELEIRPGEREGADLVLTTDDETLIAYLAGAPVPPEALRPEGDEELLRRLPELFAFG